MSINKTLLAFASSIIGVLPAQAADLALLPSASSVEVGDAFSVDLIVSGLGTNESVGVYDIDVGFDPALMAFDSATFGSGLDVLGLGSLQFVTPTPGAVNLFELSLDSVVDLWRLQPSQFTLATLSFTAGAAGTSALTMSVNAFGNAFGDELEASITGSSITITVPPPIPEPSTYALMLVGLVALRGWVAKGH